LSVSQAGKNSSCSKQTPQAFINAQSSPLLANGGVFIRDFDLLAIINLPLQEVFQDRPKQ